MKVTLRAFIQKTTLIATAFVLAVSTLTASLPFVLSQEAGAASVVNVTDLSSWWFEDKSNGHHELVASGLHVWTTGGSTDGSTRKSAGYTAVTPFPLANAADADIQFAGTPTGPLPSLQLGVDRDGNGSWDGYLVYEPWSYGVGKFWIDKPGFGVAAGQGYQSFGTIADFAAANQDAKVISVGYSLGTLGSHPDGDSVIAKLTVNGVDYAFGKAAPAVPTNLTISHNGTNVTSGTTVGSSIMNGNTVLNFSAVPGANKYITHITYPGGQKDVSNNYNNTWLVKNSLTAQGEFGAHGDGVYTYAVQSYDTTTGLKSALSAPVSLVYDSSAPTITSITANGRPVALDGSTRVNSEAGITYDVQVSDPAGVSYTYVEMNRNLGWKAAQTGGTQTTLATPANLYTDGQQYGLKICPYDKLGNGTCVQVYFVVDNTSPTLMLRVGENGPVVAAGSYLNNTGKNIRIEKENTASYSATMPDGTSWTGGVKDANYTGGKLSVDFLLTHGDGVYTFTSTDTAGNVSDPYPITIDTIAPQNITTTYTGGLKGVTTPTAVTGAVLGGNISFHISEDETNPANMYAEINWLNPITNKWEKHAGWGATITGDSGVLTLASTAPTGTYQIKVSSIRDKAGNTAATKTFSFTVDNTAPLTGAVLSSDVIVSNNTLPTLTVNATDANGIDYTQYRIQSADGSKIAGYGWVPISNSGVVELPEIAGLADGTYRVNVRTFDNAGNKKNTLIKFTIDRSITSSVAVSSLTSLKPELSGVAKHSDGSLAANVDLVVTVDGTDEYEVTTDAFGVWSIGVVVTGSEAGVSHTVAVALKGSDPAATPAGTQTFVTTLQSQTQGGSENSQGGATNTQGAAARGATQPQLPSVTGPAGQPGAAALGAGDEAGKESALGASTEKTLADAVDANNTDGKALGLAWYWWILIVAALATIVWWIVAAVRKRSAES